MPWLRKLRITIRNKDNSKAKPIVFEDHRVDVEVRSAIGWGGDTATITIFNLSVEELKFLQDKNFGNYFVDIEGGYLDAGNTGGKNAVDKDTVWGGVDVYGSGSGVVKNQQVTGGNSLFSGLITNVVGFKSPPEHVTQLFCISRASGIASTFKQMQPIPRGKTLREAITSMCNDYGFNTVTQYGLPANALEVKLPLGRTFHDTFLEEFTQLLSEYNLKYIMTTAEIQIFPDTYGDIDAVGRMGKDREPVKLDANQVIGNPIAGIATFQLTTFLNASIMPGMVLDVSPLLGTEILANGVTAVAAGNIVLNTDDSVFQYAMTDKYHIMQVVHRGSTHMKDFVTHVTAIVGGATLMGESELNWQQMYASTGMGQHDVDD